MPDLDEEIGTVELECEYTSGETVQRTAVITWAEYVDAHVRVHGTPPEEPHDGLLDLGVFQNAASEKLNRKTELDVDEILGS